MIAVEGYSGQPNPTKELSRPGEAGFFEREIHRTTDAFGAVLHAFSTYDSTRTRDAEPFARGINSFQLYSDGTRWWIVTIFWDAETSDQPIPAKYL